MSKVITLKQPWAELVVLGAKQFETRGFKTEYRGELFIHSSSHFEYDHIEMALKEPFKTALKTSAHMLKVGHVIGKFILEDCIPVEEVLPTLQSSNVGSNEIAFGDYSSGRWAWLLRHPEKFNRTMHVRGALSVWEYPGLEQFYP